MATEYLQSLCRLCGEKRAIEEGRHPHLKSKFGSSILRALGEDISGDVENVHPPFVCHPCAKKLQAWWSKAKRKIAAKCNISLFKFGKVCQAPDLSDFQKSANTHGWLTWMGPGCLHVMRMGSNGRPEICLQINQNQMWDLKVCEIEVGAQGRRITATPDSLDLPKFVDLLKVIDDHNACQGNGGFDELVRSRRGERGQIPITITGRDICQTYPHQTIRHEMCTLLVRKPQERCEVCRVLRGDLHSLSTKLKRGSAEHASPTGAALAPTTRNDRLSPSQLRAKAALLQAQRKALQRRNKVLHQKIEEIVKSEGFPVTPQHNALLEQTFTEGEETVKGIVNPSSPAYMLWEQQKLSMKRGKGMRWHPAIIRLCIALHSKSTSGYDLLRKSGFLHLPHPTTLHSYSHFATPTSGFNSDLVKRIIADHLRDDMPDHHRDVSVLFDEMKIKAGLVYSQVTGNIIGFVDVGSISNEILAFERRCKGENEVPVATHILVLMVRGIFTSLHAPIGYYPSIGVTSHQLYPCLLEATVLLENAGFRVRSLVSDGASSNRKYYRMNRDEDDTNAIVHYTRNPAQPTRLVYFFCDVPHLIKTTRNNFENSGFHNKTRHLHFKGQDISWCHILNLYEWDERQERISPGLKRLFKLRDEHIRLTPSLRMRVYLAAQILSSSVANAMKAHGLHDTKSTELFISHFDKFFDCLNVSNPHDSIEKRKPALEPYRTVDDWRFEWLDKDFLGFLQEWEEEAAGHKRVPLQERLKMCLSKETVEGLRITVKSFVALAPLLLQQPGVKYLLSEKFTQDPLEMHFSKQRGAGGCSDNPTVEQVGYNMFTFYVASSCLKASRRGNVKRTSQTNHLDSTPLPKRQRQQVDGSSL